MTYRNRRELVPAERSADISGPVGCDDRHLHPVQRAVLPRKTAKQLKARSHLHSPGWALSAGRSPRNLREKTRSRNQRTALAPDRPVGAPVVSQRGRSIPLPPSANGPWLSGRIMTISTQVLMSSPQSMSPVGVTHSRGDVGSPPCPVAARRGWWGGATARTGPAEPSGGTVRMYRSTTG